MFKSMARERDERIQEAKQEIDRLFQRRTKEVETCCTDWFIGEWQKRKEKAEREQRRFIFYAKLCKGQTQADELPIERAREIPIGDIMLEACKARTGGREKFTCPFHDGDRDPSFVWYVEQNKYHCFGCGMSGDVIDLMMKLHKIGFVEAVKQLAIH